MAQAEPTEVVTMECGYCLQKGSSLADPKTFPCSHSHCLPCLKIHFNTYQIVQCPTCSKVYDVTLASLPSANTVKGDGMCCDICVRKGGDNHPAVMYCTTCSKKYCDEHKQYHDKLMDDHPRFDIDEYRTRAKKLEKKTCVKHKDEPYSGGCKACLALFCTRCVFGMKDFCTNGGSHDLLSFDELLVSLTKDINELQEELHSKEEKLADLFKSVSIIRSDYENETAELVETIHKTRDEQIEAIRVKYDELEKELLRLRAESVETMTRFLDEEVWAQMSSLSRHRMRIEASFRDNHEVDIVNGYRDTKVEMEQLIAGEFPALQLDNSVELGRAGKVVTVCIQHIADESRDIELVIRSVEDHGLTTPKPFPKSIELLKTVTLSSGCVSVSHYQGRTYAGLYDKSIDMIDDNYQLTASFIRTDYKVLCSTLYRDRLYVLVGSSPKEVQVYDLSGCLVSRWSHTDCTNNYSSSMTGVSDQLVVPDKRHKRLTVYSLTGQILRQIPCPQLANHNVALCAVGNDSVIVSQLNSSQVFRVNITTDEVMWTTKHVSNPQGMTSYGDGYVLVASCGCNKIRILDVSSGDVLSEIADDAISGGRCVFDLHIFDDTLVVPTYDNNKLLFYKLNHL